LAGEERPAPAYAYAEPAVDAVRHDDRQVADAGGWSDDDAFEALDASRLEDGHSQPSFEAAPDYRGDFAVAATADEPRFEPFGSFEEVRGTEAAPYEQ